jgi:outer membrane protein
MNKIGGLIVGMGPDYVGSDDNQAIVVPFFKWQFEGEARYLKLMGTELTFNALDNPNFELGPVLNYRMGRDDDVDDEVVKNMAEIDDTVELGIYGAYIWRDQATPKRRLITSAEVLFDVGDEYKGWLATVDVKYWYPINKKNDFMIGIGTTYGNSDYMSTYFGVSSADAARTGLSQFNADSGFRDIHIPVGLVYHYSMQWHFIGGLKYLALLDDASDSPVVDDRGDSSQIIAGVGVGYSW